MSRVPRRLTGAGPSEPRSYLGVDLASLVQQAVRLPLWTQEFARATPEVRFAFIDKGPLCRSTGRMVNERGTPRLSIAVGLGADHADLFLVLLHELAHAYAGEGHGLPWRQALRTAGIQMYGGPVAQRIPDLRGLKFRELEDAVAEGIRAALRCGPAPDYLVWKPAPVVATLPAPAALCPTWQRAVATGRATPYQPRRGAR